MKDSKVRGLSGRDFSWTLCGNVTYSFCQWAFVIVLAKLGSPDDVGGYALGIAVGAPLLTFANCQSRNLVASDIQNRHSFGEYLGLRVLSLAAALVVVAFLAAWTGKTKAEALVICLLGLSQAFDWMSETYFGLLQKFDRLDRTGQSLMLKGVLCLILMAVIMYTTRSLVWAALGLVVGRGLVLWCFDARVASRIAGRAKPVWSAGKMAELFRSALPLGIIAAISAFNFNIPRYFIESDLGTRHLGIFSAIASLVGAGNLIMSALANSSFVAIARAVVNGDRKQYRLLSLRLLGTASGLGLAGVAVSMLAGRWILMKLFRPEYGSSASVFTLLMLAGALTYLISGQGYALTAARVLTPQIPILGCAAITTALFSWWLVPARGIEGAAEASLLSSAVTLALSSVILARVHPGTEKTRLQPFEPVPSEAA